MEQQRKRVRRRWPVAMALLILAAVPVCAQTSIGIIVGEPTGVSGKLWLTGEASLDVALAWSFVGSGAFYVHVDYQHHFDDLDFDPGEFLWYIGGGAQVTISSAFALGVRVPVGLVYHFDDMPIEAFIEAAPGLLLFPAVRFTAGGGVGVRYRL